MLKLDFWTVVFQVVNFTALALLLYWLLFKPMSRMIRARQEEKERLVRELEHERQMLSVQRANLDERLSRLDEETANILMLAREQAEADRAELLQEARAEVEQILAEAHTDAYRIRKQAVDTFHGDLINALLDVSGIVIGNVVSPQVHDAMVRQLTDHIWEMGRTEIQRVEAFRQSLGSREPTAHITTAKPLTQDHQGLLARTFTALADRHINLEVRIDHKMVAGVRVRIGDLMVDSSIMGQLEELREQAAQSLEEIITYE
ncbi:MAG: F0F1 ATP synthase subunit delta [Anaerolineae bacterium]|nr:F0F1 ATP synthase subunit delta [Anaerolineae bacterium]